ncbi:MAG: chorion class high-cysteine HCB protein 13 [Candidatus Gallimonas sp.]
MNCFTGNNSCLWILIILLILGTCGNVFSSSVFTGCGWPVLAALVYCLCKNGTLGAIFNRGGCGCGCNG